MQMKMMIFLGLFFSLNAHSFTSDEYQSKNIDLGALLYSNLEIEQKSCKAVSDKNPSSLIKWWDSVKNYRASEISRDTAYKVATQNILKQIEELKHFDEAKKQIQILNLNLELVNLSISNIEGENGRLTIRNKLLNDLEEAKKLNVTEYSKIVSSYNLLRENYIAKGLEIAKKACERIKNKKLDPVKGCEKAQADYKTMLEKQLVEFAQILNTEKIASIDLNDKLAVLLQKLIDTYSQIPTSDDSSYDWKISSIESELKNLQKYTKEAGTKCPSSAPTNIVSTETTQLLSAIGLSDNQEDLISNFKLIWPDINAVIGGSYQRDNYFPLYKNVITDLNTYDLEYLDSIKANKEKLTALIDTLNKNLSDGNDIKPQEINELIQDTITKTSTTSSSSELASNAAINVNTTSTNSAIKTKNSATTTSASTNSSSTATGSVSSSIGNSAITSNAIATTSKSNSTQSTSSSITSKTTSSTISTASNSVSNAISSNGTLKKLQTSNSKNLAISVATSSTAIAVTKTPTQDSISDKLKKIKIDLLTSKLKTSNLNESNVASNNANASKNNLITKPKIQINYELNEDNLNFQNALLNVSKENKMHFEPTENDTIFEVLTKAYMRNLNKLDKTAE